MIVNEQMQQLATGALNRATENLQVYQEVNTTLTLMQNLRVRTQAPIDILGTFVNIHLFIIICIRTATLASILYVVEV